jgi:transposase
LSQKFVTFGSDDDQQRSSPAVPGQPGVTPKAEVTGQPPADPAPCQNNRAPNPTPDLPRLQQPRRGRRLTRKGEEPASPLTGEQRLLVLDAWQRSGLPARDFAPLVGMSRHTLYSWKKKFDTEGPAGLMDKPRGGPQGSRLPELTKRSILMLKQANPEWGVERITAMLLRGPGLQASPGAVARVLHEAGYELEEAPTKPHPDKVRRFERAAPNQLWQTDLFTKDRR